MGVGESKAEKYNKLQDEISTKLLEMWNKIKMNENIVRLRESYILALEKNIPLSGWQIHTNYQTIVNETLQSIKQLDNFKSSPCNVPDFDVSYNTYVAEMLPFVFKHKLECVLRKNLELYIKGVPADAFERFWRAMKAFVDTIYEMTSRRQSPTLNHDLLNKIEEASSWSNISQRRDIAEHIRTYINNLAAELNVDNYQQTTDSKYDPVYFKHGICRTNGDVEKNIPKLNDARNQMNKMYTEFFNSYLQQANLNKLIANIPVAEDNAALVAEHNKKMEMLRTKYAVPVSGGADNFAAAGVYGVLIILYGLLILYLLYWLLKIAKWVIFGCPCCQIDPYRARDPNPIHLQFL